MVNPPVTADAEQLLQHASWIRRLARTLVGNAQAAEDLAQETWVRALEHPPRADRPLRGWLATVMRNLLLQGRRGEHARRGREEQAAREEALASSLELFEQVSSQRHLAKVVLELPEPYRTAILLRYYEECSPRRMADLLGVPVPTVKTRLSRGLALLRARLQCGAGAEDRAWIALLLPLARRPAGWSPPPWSTAWATAASSLAPIGAFIVKAKIAVVALIAAATATIAYVATSDAPPRNPPGAAVAAQSPPAPRAPRGQELEAAETPGIASREQAPALPQEEAVEVAKPTPPTGQIVRGRVIDVHSSPVSLAPVRLAAEFDAAEGSIRAAENMPQALSGSDGSFELSSDKLAGNLVVLDERTTTVLAGIPLPSEGGRQTIVVVAPRLRLSGTVVDESGLPIEGAKLWISLPDEMRGRLEAVLDFSEDVPMSAQSDAQGRFEFSAAPSVQGGSVLAGKEGYVPGKLELPVASTADLLIVLKRPDLSDNQLRGRVVDAAGVAVEKATVSFGLDTTRTDSQGRFAFDLASESGFNAQVQAYFPFVPDRLIALKRGYLPGEATPRGTDADGRPVWPDLVVLRLGLEPLSIRGRVEDVDGKPARSIRVWIADPTFFGVLGDASEGEFRPTHVENELAGADPGWRFVESDKEGRFELSGLMDREYTIEAMDRRTLLRAVVPLVRAGSSNVVVRMPKDAVYGTLRGRVVDRKGTPLRNIDIFPMCDAFLTRVAGNVISTQHDRTDEVSTDSSGRFELKNVPRNLVYLRLNGEDTIPLEWGRHVEGGLQTLVGENADDLVITLGRRCHFQVELADPSEADEVAVLDGKGDELEISEFLGNSRRENMRQPLHKGRSNTLGVSDEATALVLYAGGAEVRRAPIDLVPGERTTLRP
jgi:RNA polymerase sigma-70 factor (ECF subfamily)